MNSPDKERRGYDESFKIEALRLWKTTEQSAGEVAKGLGISPATLYSWGGRPAGKEPSRRCRQHLDPGDGNGRSRACGTTTRKLREQREVLKKTLAILFESSRASRIRPNSHRRPAG